MASQIHKVFISYHHCPADEHFRNRFEALFVTDQKILINKSVQIGDIDPNLKTETIRQKIRDEYLRDSSVTIVLIGKDTWQRKHVDWEISSSIRDSALNPRSGLLGIFLPSYPVTLDTKGNPEINKHTIPPRLYDNFECGYSKLYRWSENSAHVQDWIHRAFEARLEKNPDNSRDLFVKNRTTDQWE